MVSLLFPRSSGYGSYGGYGSNSYGSSLYGIDSGVYDFNSYQSFYQKQNQLFDQITDYIVNMLDKLPPEVGEQLLNQMPDWLADSVKQKQETQQAIRTAIANALNPTPTPEEQPTAVNSATSVDNTSGGDAPADEKRVLDRINGERAKQGLPPLKLATGGDFKEGTDAASQYMADHNNMSHDYWAQGHTEGGARAENVAAGQQSADEVSDAWINSPGHYANLMNGDYTEVAVSKVVDSDGTTYWTTRFR